MRVEVCRRYRHNLDPQMYLALTLQRESFFSFLRLPLKTERAQDQISQQIC